MRKYPLVIGVLIMLLNLTLTLSWASEQMPNSAKALALGNAGSALTGGLGEVLSYNPALLSYANTGATVFYTNEYAIPGLVEQSVSVSFKTGKMHWGTMIIKNEAALLEERQGEICENKWDNLKIGLGSSIKAGRNLSFGWSFWLNTQDIVITNDPEGLAGKDSRYYLNAGLSYNRSRFGLSAVAEGLLDDDFSQLKLGLRFGEPGNLQVLGELKYDLLDGKLNYCGGVEGWIAPNFALRAGVDQAGMFSAGLGLGKGALSFDYAYRVHPAGNTHYLSSGYRF